MFFESRCRNIDAASSCPFCASSDLELVSVLTASFRRSEYVACRSCGGHGPVVSETEGGDAATACWNSRRAAKLASHSDSKIASRW